MTNASVHEWTYFDHLYNKRQTLIRDVPHSVCQCELLYIEHPRILPLIHKVHTAQGQSLNNHSSIAFHSSNFKATVSKF